MRRGVGEDLEATQFPLTAGVFLESIYRSPPPLVVSCRGNRTRSFSLSRRMSHSLPVHTQPRTCDGRARAPAPRRSLFNSLRVYAAEKYSRALSRFPEKPRTLKHRLTCKLLILTNKHGVDVAYALMEAINNGYHHEILIGRPELIIAYSRDTRINLNEDDVE